MNTKTKRISTYIFITFVLFATIVFAFNLFSNKNRAYAISETNAIEFYFDDGEDVELISAHTVNEGDNFFDIPQKPEQIGYILSWYDSLEKKVNLQDGIYDVQQDMQYILRYDLFFNSETLNQAEGTSQNPFIIDTPERFALFGEYCNLYDTLEKNFVIVNDLNLQGYEIEVARNFYGVLDGRNAIISNLVITASEYSSYGAGIIDENYGEINNLHLIDSMVSGPVFAAGIACQNFGIIKNCSFYGYAYSDSISGGISAVNEGSITNSFNRGIVQGDEASGGISGRNSGDIYSSYNMGNIRSKKYAGGIAGLVEDGEVSYVYNTSDIWLYPDADDYYVGALVAKLSNNASLNNSYNKANVRISDDYGVFNAYSGGIVGFVENTSDIYYCYYNQNIQVDKNPFENKDGWLLDEFDNVIELDSCEKLSTLDLTGGENLYQFVDGLVWIHQDENLQLGKVYYPQLTQMKFSSSSYVVEQSYLSSQTDYDVCDITLYDDYGNLDNAYQVLSGTHQLPPVKEKSGYTSLGWSPNMDGTVLDSEYTVMLSSAYYAVYEYNQVIVNINDETEVYDNTLTLQANASHEDPDAFISYEWYKIVDETPQLLSDITSDYLSLSQVNQSGEYRIKVRAESGKYLSIAEISVQAEILAYTYNIVTPLFTKIYSQQDGDLVQIYDIPLPSGNQICEVQFIRQQGENAGSYDILSAYVLGDENISINFTTPQEDMFIIQKASYEYSFSFNDEEFEYDNEEHILSYEADLPEGLDVYLTVSGDGKSAGTHYVTAHFVGDFSNYNYISPVQQPMIITKADYNMENVDFYSVGKVYSGQAHQVYMQGQLPDGVSVSYSITNAVDVGTYYVLLTFDGDYRNYNPIPQRQETITIIPKSISPIFQMPGNMMYDGEEKEIIISAEGIYQRDEVNFSYVTNAPLVQPGHYYVEAKCDNINYILHNNTIVVEINKPYVENSGGEYIDIRVYSQNGVENDIMLLADKASISESILKRLGDKQQIRIFSISMFAGDELIEESSEYFYKLAVSNDFNDENLTELYYYDMNEDMFVAIEYEIEDGFLVFSSENTNYLVLASNITGDSTHIPDEAFDFDWLAYTLFVIFILIAALVALLVYFAVSGEDRQAKPILAPKPQINPLSEAQRKELYKKMKDGRFADWELDRDLPLYSKWKFYKIKDDINK